MLTCLITNQMIGTLGRRVIPQQVLIFHHNGCVEIITKHGTNGKKENVSDVSDTFSFFPSYKVAEICIYIENIVKACVACLGGPNFNQSLVKTLLANKNILTSDSGWFFDEALGWSEHSLQRKLGTSGINIHHIHASATILRPPSKVLGNHSKKPCANANLSDNKPNDWDFRKKGNTTASSYFPPQRLRGNNHQTWDQYLLWNDADSLIYLLPCEFPYPPEQLFIQYDKDD